EENEVLFDPTFLPLTSHCNCGSLPAFCITAAKWATASSQRSLSNVLIWIVVGSPFVTIILIELDVTCEVLEQEVAASGINMQFTMSPSCSVVVENVGASVPASTPLIFQW